MFVLAPIDEKWKHILEEHNTSKYYKHYLSEAGYWYIDHDKQEALFCTEAVSESIVRCDPGQSYYSFSFLVKDSLLGIGLDFYSLAPHYSRQWHEKNKISLGGTLPDGMSRENIINDAKDAILCYINNGYDDYQNLKEKRGLHPFG